MSTADTQSIAWLTPNWPAPVNVRALTTTRGGGVSQGPYASLNLATHVGDDRDAVLRNRSLLRRAAKLPAEPIWLEQVHGTTVWTGGPTSSTPVADASVAKRPGEICTILTADCLPVLFCDIDGRCVGAAHAGWRGLAGGVLEATLKAMSVSPQRVIAWLGPAIEQAAFEVGDEVRDAFLARNDDHATAFERNARDRWQADIYRLAHVELASLGVAAVYGGGWRCFADTDRFYSYRRAKTTGRMASMVWME